MKRWSYRREGGGTGTEVIPRYQVLREWDCDRCRFGFGRILEEEVAWNGVWDIFELHGASISE